MKYFQIRQQVSTVKKSWMEVVEYSEFERPMQNGYENLVAQNPDEYFELVEVTSTETCLRFTPKRT